VTERTPFSRRTFLSTTAAGIAAAQFSAAPARGFDCASGTRLLHVPFDIVPAPELIAFRVQYPGKPALQLRGHFWYNAPARHAGRRLPAIVELNPYRRRDGMLYVDSMMYPWFAFKEYCCFRVDLQGSGDSDGVMNDEYSDEELSYCVQVVEQIARLSFCDGNVAMMGKSWSAINSLMVAARDDAPKALKTVLFCCGTDDRFNDDVHYKGGTMMYDNAGWAASMWGWMPMPPDPLVVGDRWKSMWRERIEALEFWFERWGTHQTRDAYWRDTSVRDRMSKIRIPVYVVSGWQDGYKNPAARIVTALGERGVPVEGVLGPWGHKYPFDGFPSPHIEWLDYIVTHWWDRWLKGREPEASTQRPQLMVWMGESRGPQRTPDYRERGRWVAEDWRWQQRIRPLELLLQPGRKLAVRAGALQDNQRWLHASSDVLLGTDVLETSSWGECDNPDLPGDQRANDERSLSFDTPPLAGDLACFGRPLVRLVMRSTRAIASIAVRLCEIEPLTGRSHMVTWNLWSLAYRNGDLQPPSTVPVGTPFSVEFPLDILGHVFRRGWRIRLAIAPSFDPAMWANPKPYDVAVLAGGNASALVLPLRDARAADAALARRFALSQTSYADPSTYAPILRTVRDESNVRTARIEGTGPKQKLYVRKKLDSGSFVYGGVLDDLLVDETAEEDFTLTADAPLSGLATTRYDSHLRRRDWNVRAVTTTRVWSDSGASRPEFRYRATVETYVDEHPFVRREIEGRIPRRWI
jgi:putative CocE/NonD family hydrolase